MMKKTGSKTTSVIIVGAGMAGLALAGLLARAGLRVTVIDREDPEKMATETFDSRTVALSLGTRAVLSPLGAWDDMKEWGEAIRLIDVQEGHDPFVLNFDASESEDGAFGWILPNTRVRSVLYKTAKTYGAIFVRGLLADIEQNETGATAVLADGTHHTAQLLIGADGRHSRVRDLLGVDTVNLNYKQTALVGLIAHEHPHHGLALERFYPEGPFAVLPFTDDGKTHRSAVVWTRHAPQKLNTPSLDDLTGMIAPMLDDRYGKTKATGLWAAYPLGLTHAKQFVAGRVVLISDAAHAMHPIAGQGLNVGMRDVSALAALLSDSSDAGDAEILKRYQTARRFDVMTMMAATDLLNRLFGNDLRVVRGLRSLGLGLVDRVPRLKKFFTGVATGT